MSSPDSIGYNNPTINDVVIPLEDMEESSKADNSDVDNRIQKAKKKQMDDLAGIYAIAGALPGVGGFMCTLIGSGLWLGGSVAGPILTGVGLGIIVIVSPFCGLSCYYDCKKNSIEG